MPDALTMFQYIMVATSVILVITQCVMLALIAFIYSEINMKKDRRAEQRKLEVKEEET